MKGRVVIMRKTSVIVTLNTFHSRKKMHQNQILVTLTTKNMGHSADYTKIIFEMDKSFGSYNTEFQQLLMVGETFTLYRHPIVTIIVK